jgi:hypothetical protein
LKGSGWIRSVNLIRPSAPTYTTQNASVAGSFYTWIPMTKGKASQTHVDWAKFETAFTVTQGEYALSIAHNNDLTGGVPDTLCLANIALVEDRFPADTHLSDLKVGNLSLENFAPGAYVYRYKLPYSWETGKGFPAIEPVKQENTSVSIVPAVSLSGNESAATATITVTNESTGKNIVYKIIFYRAGSGSDARLENIKIDGANVRNFDMNTLAYAVSLPYTYRAAPDIAGSSFGEGASVAVTPPVDINGSQSERTAWIRVTSSDRSTTERYSVVFDVMPELDLFLCIGQSNMAGRGEINPALGDLNPMSNVWLFDPGDGWETAVNPLNKHSEIRKELSMQKICPAYSFAGKIAAETNRQIGLIVNARGGTVIESWLKDSPDGYYESSLRRALEAQKWGTFKAILWHQGEGNAGSEAKILAYPGQLKKMVADWRSDLKMPNLFFVAGELARWRNDPNSTVAQRNALFNAVIDTVSAYIPYASVATSEDLTPINGDTTDPHFDRESQLKLGERYAREVLKAVYGLTSVSNPAREPSHARIYARGGTVHIDSDVEAAGSVYVADVTGRIVVRSTFGRQLEIPLEEKGVYVVSLNMGSEILNSKICVR